MKDRLDPARAHRGVIEPEVEVTAQGSIAVSDEPGTGYRIREDLVEELTVRKETLRAKS